MVGGAGESHSEFEEFATESEGDDDDASRPIRATGDAAVRANGDDIRARDAERHRTFADHVDTGRGDRDLRGGPVTQRVGIDAREPLLGVRRAEEAAVPRTGDDCGIEQLCRCRHL